MLHFKVELDSGEPVYEQIARSLRQLVHDGLLPAGSKLPSMRELSEMLGTSINTVHAAIDLLAAENLIVTRRGSGSFVTAQPEVASGTNLRSSADLPGGRSPMPWETYAFSSDFFLVPPAPNPAGLISFARASPDPALYPFDRIKQIVTSMLWSPQELFFDSGHPQGYLPLVDHLEKVMALSGVAMAEGENDIILTSGFQRALSVVLGLLVKPGGKVAIESPGYSALINLLLAERIDFVPIPVDAEGMDTQHLARQLERGGIQAVITVPTFHNPTGVTLSPARRAHLLDLAERHRLPVIEDDWGRELVYDGAAPPPLKALDTGGYVIHIGTYSKSFMPGLRLGWVTCPSRLARTLVYAKLGSDQGDSFFLQAVMYEFIRKGHYARHLRHVVREYRKRRNTLCRALARQLPPGCTFDIPAGGFSVWLRLPPAIQSLPLLTLAREAGVEFLPAAYCRADRQDANALRLSFSRSSVDEIETGTTRLCQLLKRCIERPGLLARGAKSFKDLSK